MIIYIRTDELEELPSGHEEILRKMRAKQRRNFGHLGGCY